MALPPDAPDAILDSRPRGLWLLATVAAGGRASHRYATADVTVCAYDPPRLAVVFPTTVDGARFVRQGEAFALSLVAADQAQPLLAPGGLSDASGWLRAASGCPVLADAVGYLDCRLQSAVDLGDSLLAIGDLKAGGLLQRGKAALTAAAFARMRGAEGAAAGPEWTADDDGARLAPALPGGPPDRELLDSVLARAHTGLALATTGDGQAIGLQVTAWTAACPGTPRGILCGFDRSGDAAGLLRRGGVFALSLLATDQLPLVLGLFGDGARDGAAGGPLDDLALRFARTGCPILETAVAYLDCAVERLLEPGTDALLAVGRILEGGWLRPYKRQLTDAELRAALTE